MSIVTEVAPADSAAALAHFEAAFTFETDCWDVHHSLTSGAQDFVLWMPAALKSTRPAMYRARSILGTEKSSARQWRSTRQGRCSWCTARARTVMAQRARRSSWPSLGVRSS